MRLATWNINSVRLRLDMVLDYLKQHKIDVLCLQETKCPDNLFPMAAFEEAGYAHNHISGMKGYNGVAIISRIPLRETGQKNFYDLTDSRHISAVLDNGVELHNFYVPAGGDIPQMDNPKFVHKLAFVDEMAAWWKNGHDASQPKIMVGDLNIAPGENDVWSHKQMLKIISHTEVEVEKLTAMQKAGKWIDAVRHFVPDEEKLYSWWSYRARDWNSSDRGRRLDHIWVTPPLAGKLKAHETIREARGWKPKPSDHVPVMVEFDL